MKLEKMLKTVLSSALLIALAAAAGAAEKTTPDAGAVPAITIDIAGAAEAAPALDRGCEKAAGSPLFQLAFEKISASFSQSCGSCSTSGCAGGFIGQMCWTGGINGQWGNCNLYTGGYVCSDGNWECSCGYGPIH